MKSWLFLGASSGVVVVVVAQGCGGNSVAFSSTGGGGGSESGSSSGSSSSGVTSSSTSSGTGGGASSSGSSGTTTSSSSSTSSSTSASSSTGGNPCTDEIGAYSVMITGQGCSDLAAGAPQCIKAGGAVCQVQLVSQGAAGAAVNGTVTLDASGDFTGGSLKEGSVGRTGCTGTWNAAASQLTIDCGGVGTSQSCVATLTRTGNTCP